MLTEWIWFFLIDACTAHTAGARSTPSDGLWTDCTRRTGAAERAAFDGDWGERCWHWMAAATAGWNGIKHADCDSHRPGPRRRPVWCLLSALRRMFKRTMREERQSIVKNWSLFFFRGVFSKEEWDMGFLREGWRGPSTRGSGVVGCAPPAFSWLRATMCG